MPRTYSPTYARTYYLANKRCWREKNWKNITTKEGKAFTELDYDRAYQIQSGCCKLCGVHSTAFNSHLAVDHDHKTGYFRGLLCRRCNTRLGVYEEPHSLEKFVQYLKGEL